MGDWRLKGPPAASWASRSRGVHPHRELLAQHPEPFRVDPHPAALHRGEHRDEGHLDLFVHPLEGGPFGKPGGEEGVQAQGHLRVLRGVGPRLVERDLVERDLLHPLARHLLVLAGPDSEVLGRQGVHVVAGRGAVEHVGLEHRVVRDAGHRDAVVREHAHVVLEVVTDLGPVRVLQDRAERAENLLLAELVRRPGVPVRERDVRALAGGDREGDPDDPRIHVVETGGLGIDGEDLRARDPLHPPAKCVFGEHRLVRRLACPGGRGLALRPRSLASSRLVQERAEQRAELEPAVQGLQDAAVRGAGAQRPRALPDLHVAADRHEPAREVHRALRRPVRRQERAQVLADLPPDRGRVGPDPVEGVVGGEPFDGRLRPDLGNARHVVHRVADEGQVVHDAVGANSEPRLDPGLVQDGVVHGVHEGGPPPHELRHVLVVGGDDHPEPALAGAIGEGADDVVRLHAGHAQEGQAEGADELMERLDLLAELARHGGAVRLVLGIPLVAEGLPRRVEDDREVLARIVGPEPAEHVDDPEDRSGRRPVGVGEGRHRVEGPKEVRRAVHEYDGG